MSDKIYKSFDEWFDGSVFREEARTCCNVAWDIRNSEIQQIREQIEKMKNDFCMYCNGECDACDMNKKWELKNVHKI